MSDMVAWLQSVGARASAGSEWVMRCPWCSKDRLYVNSEPGEAWDLKELPAGRWICFSCQEKSLGLSKLMAEMDGISFADARAIVGKWKLDGISFHHRAPVAPVVRPEGAPWLPLEFEPVYDGNRWLWPKYLTSRRIERSTARLLNLGVCRTGDYADRIVLPIDCPLGKDFQARAIHPKVEPRYMSGPYAGQLLFGWQTVADSDFALLVEGPFDAIRTIQAGIPTVALMGKTLRDGQWEMLAKRQRQYVVMLDPPEKDPAAIDSACDIAWKIGATVGVTLKTDPGDASEDEVIAAVSAAVSPRDAQDAATSIRLAQNRERLGR